jgi:hypothetical protein
LGQIVWIVLGAIWLGRRRDEIPLITSLLLFYVFTFRFWALLEAWTGPVNLSNFGFESVDLENALSVQRLALLGESVFLGVYMLAQRRAIKVPKNVASGELLRCLRLRLFAMALFCIPIAIFSRVAVRAQVASGKSMGFEISSYMILFPLALVGIAILLAALWKAGGLQTPGQRFLAALLFGLIAYLTFQPSLRFQFLGWLLAATIIFSSGQSLARRATVATTGGALAIALFTAAGALRPSEAAEEGFEQQAWERFAFAKDANMLDGFVLLRQVYPAMLDYSHGREHLEILERPIPRSLWPDKPVGGYMNKLGIVTADTGFTLGISPSLFGSFYQEGGWLGIVLFSVLYGFAFAILVRFSMSILPLTGLIIRGMACAALVPLLRGGDLPGIYAWFGMSFWPCLLLFWLRRREFFARIPYWQQFAGDVPVRMKRGGSGEHSLV